MLNLICFHFQDTLKDIEGHSELLKLLLSFCEVLENSDKIRRVKRIETAWHSVWLRALEWECLLEHTGGEEAKEGIILQSDSSNIEEDNLLKPASVPDNFKHLVSDMANKNVIIVRRLACSGEILTSTKLCINHELL